MDIRFASLSDGYELTAVLGPGQEISCRISPPTGKVTFVDILPDVFAVADALIMQAARRSADGGQAVTCAKGCAMCCRHLVAVSTHEALLAAHVVGLLQDELQTRIRQAFQTTVARLEERGLLSEMLDSHANSFADRGRIVAVQRRYWEMQLPCPFLLDESCAIYPYRPLLCRQYMAVSPPVHCRGSFVADHLVRKLPLACDLASAAASFDGLSAQATRPVPLPALLLINGLLTRQAPPKTSATAMLTAFLRHAADNFSR